MDSLEQICSAISNTVFPIVMCVLLYLKDERFMKEISEKLTMLVDAVRKGG